VAIVGALRKTFQAMDIGDGSNGRFAGALRDQWPRGGRAHRRSPHASRSGSGPAAVRAAHARASPRARSASRATRPARRRDIPHPPSSTTSS